MLNPLEKSVLDRLLQKKEEPFETLRRQLSLAAVSTREFTGVGFFTQFALPQDAQVNRDLSDMTLGGIGATIPGLEHGAGFLLFIRGGVVSMLEGFTYDETWPDNIDKFTLFETG
jgi:hypothetical protein